MRVCYGCNMIDHLLLMVEAGHEDRGGLSLC